MNLDLGILWIEDSFNPQEEADLRRRVQQAGFLARINNIPNGTGIEEIAREHQLYHVYDIILLDYRLEDEDGDDLAPKIRGLFPATSILFYSGSKSDAELRHLIAAKEVEGVFCSARDRFIERAGALIDQTARSLDRLSGMRGLAMRVVAECDELMKTAVLSMSARDPNCAGKIADLDKSVLEDMENVKAAYQAAGDLIQRIETRAVDSTKLFKHFRRLTKIVAANPNTFGLDDDGVEQLRELRGASAQYDQKVLRKRNVLGHVVEVQGDNGWVLSGSSEISISDFGEIRQVFAAHIDAFRRMAELVMLLDGEQAG
jgi:CheY-like chemotaxis protein